MLDLQVCNTMPGLSFLSSPFLGSRQHLQMETACSLVSQGHRTGAKNQLGQQQHLSFGDIITQELMNDLVFADLSRREEFSSPTLGLSETAAMSPVVDTAGPRLTELRWPSGP